MYFKCKECNEEIYVNTEEKGKLQAIAEYHFRIKHDEELFEHKLITNN